MRLERSLINYTNRILQHNVFRVIEHVLGGMLVSMSDVEKYNYSKNQAPTASTSDNTDLGTVHIRHLKGFVEGIKNNLIG